MLNSQSALCLSPRQRAPHMSICSSSKKVSIEQLSLPKVAFGVPKVDMSGEPEARLDGTLPALQNQI